MVEAVEVGRAAKVHRLFIRPTPRPVVARTPGTAGPGKKLLAAAAATAAAATVSASDPVEDQRWASEVNGQEIDKPWMFLAAVIELFKAMETGRSGLPIPKDATCSGVQIYSGALRDELGGQKTGLVPADAPGDIYSEIANKVIERRKNGETWDLKDSQLMVLDKMVEAGIVCRKSAKKPVMTFTYGVTLSTVKMDMASFIQDFMKDAASKGTMIDIDSFSQAGSILGTVYWDQMQGSLPKAFAAMEVFKNTGLLLKKANINAQWTTPDGFVVYSGYVDDGGLKRFVVPGLGEVDVQRFRLPENLGNTGKVSRKQGTATAPNVVHSLDGYLLRDTMRRLSDRGVEDFLLVHDSFAVHPGRVDDLAEQVRESFIAMSEANPLGAILDEMNLWVPESMWDKVESLPTHGGLDLGLVRDSRYFFA